MNRGDFLEVLSETLARREIVRPSGAIDRNAVLLAVGDAIAAALEASETVNIPFVGRLGTALRGARKGRNPRTGAVVAIGARRVATFHPGAAIKRRLNPGRGRVRSAAPGEWVAIGRRGAAE